MFRITRVRHRVRGVRLIHTCYRITDPERSVAFYEALGLEKRRELPIRDEATNIFMGVPGEELPELELTYNHGVGGYELGTAFGHLAIGVDDIARTCERVRENGGAVTRAPGPVKGGSTIIAFVEDPDRYKIELIETSSRE